jgi:hypothetical protein
MRRLLLILLLLASAGCQFAVHNSARNVGANFAKALQGDSDVHVSTYMTPDGEVFLQGAQTPLAPAAFDEYLNGLKRGKQRFHVASRVFVTHAGVGWLLTIDRFDSLEQVESAASGQLPELWMEASIRGDRVDRAWIHFTREALARLSQRADAYRAAAEKRNMPVPDGWIDGTPALIAAAEQLDRKLDPAGGLPVPEPAGLWLTLLVGGVVAGAVGVQNGRRKPLHEPLSTDGDCRQRSLHARLAERYSAPRRRTPL